MHVYKLCYNNILYNVVQLYTGDTRKVTYNLLEKITTKRSTYVSKVKAIILLYSGIEYGYFIRDNKYYLRAWDDWAQNGETLDGASAQNTHLFTARKRLGHHILEKREHAANNVQIVHHWEGNVYKICTCTESTNVGH